MFMKTILFPLFIFTFFVTGCATPVYKRVFNEESIGNSKEFFVSQSKLYQATIKVLCAKNFIIENEDKEKGFILGKRSFQQGKKITALLVQAKIIPSNENKSTLYLNALETTEVTYVADRTRPSYPLAKQLFHRWLYSSGPLAALIQLKSPCARHQS